MTLERTRENFCPFHTEVDPAIRNGGNGGLGNSGEFGEPALAELLELAKNPDRFADRNFNPFRLGRNSFISWPPVIVRSNLNDLDQMTREDSAPYCL
jgi:hypothetical protein